MKKRFFAALFPVAMACAALALPYDYVQTTPQVLAAQGSRFVTLHVHVHNTGRLAAACVKASGQKRITGVSAAGDADVSFDSLPVYKGYTVSCQAN
jgi:hypothetical protein